MLMSLSAVVWQLLHHRLSRAVRTERGESGDVPGWVLITLMTAGIVTALWIVAEPKLSGLLSGALDITGDPNGK